MLYQTELIHIRCNFQLPSHLLDTDFISKIVFMCAFHFNSLIFVVGYVSVFWGLTFFSNSGPFSMALIIVSDSLLSNCLITVTMPVSERICVVTKLSMASTTFDQGLSKTPAY